MNPYDAMYRTFKNLYWKWEYANDKNYREMMKEKRRDYYRRMKKSSLSHKQRSSRVPK